MLRYVNKIFGFDRTQLKHYSSDLIVTSNMFEQLIQLQFPLFNQASKSNILNKEYMSQLSQNEMKKSARFATVDEVFTYTAQKPQDSENSLLLTPRQIRHEEQILLSLKKSNDKDRSQSRKGHHEVQQKRKTLNQKREKFRKRLSQLPANFHNDSNQLLNQQTVIFHKKLHPNQQPNAVKRGEGVKMDIQEPRQAKFTESSSAWVEKKANGVDSINSVEEKTKLGFYVQPLQNSKNEVKLTFQESNQLSTQNLTADQSLEKNYRNQLKNNRVTMDCQSILKELGVLFEEKQEKQRSSQESQMGKAKTQINESKRSTMFDKEGQNLVSKAYRRLSQEGKKVSMVKKKNRVTLNFNQIQNALAEIEPNNAILIKGLRKQAEERQLSKKNQAEKQDQQTRRSILEKYINQEEMRQRVAKQNCEKIRRQKQRLQHIIERLDQFQKQLDEKIKEKKQKSLKQDAKIDELLSSICSPEEVSQLLDPSYYLRSQYNVNIVDIISRSKGFLRESTCYQIKFIVDQLVYCKIIANEGQAKSLTFLSLTTFDKRTNQWSIDLQLRQTLLRKYAQKNLLSYEPILTVMKLGRFWTSLQKIERDFQAIDQIFDLFDLNLDEQKDQLNFKIQIKYSLFLEVRINFLNVRKEGYFHIRSEPQNLLDMESKENDQLLEFLITCVQLLNA